MPINTTVSVLFSVQCCKLVVTLYLIKSTFTVQTALKSPDCAVITHDPSATGVTIPPLTFAISILLDVHTTACVELEGSTVATNVIGSNVSNARDALSRVIPVVGIQFEVGGV